MRSRASILPRSCWRWIDRLAAGLEGLAAALLELGEPFAERVLHQRLRR